MACLCTGSGCPFIEEGIQMRCSICPYSDGEEDYPEGSI